MRTGIEGICLFLNDFPNFLYRNLDSLKPSNLVHEAKETKCNGITHEQEEEPHDFRGGGQDP